MTVVVEEVVAPERLERLGHALVEHETGLIKAQVESVRRAFPEYVEHGISVASMSVSARRNVDEAVRSLVGPAAWRRSTGQDEAYIAHERARQGLPLDTMLDGFRLKHRVVRDGFVRIARDQGASDSVVLSALTRLNDAADAASSRLVHARRALDADLHPVVDVDAVRSVRRLLAGRSGLLEADVIGLGLRMGESYRAVKASSLEGANERLGEQLRSASWNRGGGIIVEASGQLVGLVSVVPVVRGHAAVVAVGEPRALSDASASFRTAARVYAAAQRFGLRGAVCAEQLGMKLAIAADDATGRLLVERYLDPLASEGPFGDVLEASIIEYLKSKCELKRAARSLHVHPNTLKHRLTRFQEVSRCDLGEPRVLAELWWAVEARSLVAPDS